jgi:hypothetical protein
MNENIIVALVSLVALICLFGIKYLKNSAYKNTPEAAIENETKPSSTAYHFKISFAEKLKVVVVFSVFFSFFMNIIIGLE